MPRNKKSVEQQIDSYRRLLMRRRSWYTVEEIAKDIQDGVSEKEIINTSMLTKNELKKLRKLLKTNGYIS